MTLPVLVPILCACAWTGKVHTRGRCPACGADYTHRVSPGRLAWLRAIAAGTPERPNPQTIRWLYDKRELIGPRDPGPGYVLTAAGERVIVAAQLAEHEDGLKRELVAESAARHNA